MYKKLEIHFWYEIKRNGNQKSIYHPLIADTAKYHRQDTSNATRNRMRFLLYTLDGTIYPGRRNCPMVSPSGICFWALSLFLSFVCSFSLSNVLKYHGTGDWNDNPDDFIIIWCYRSVIRIPAGERIFRERTGCILHRLLFFSISDIHWIHFMDNINEGVIRSFVAIDIVSRAKIRKNPG